MINFMRYDLTTIIRNKTFDETIALAIAELAKKGFGVLNNLDLKQVINSKIDKNIQKYVILSACNPHFAHKLIKDEDLIGLFLPCNVLIQELDDGTIKLSIINPELFIDILNNPRVNTLILSVKKALNQVVLDIEELTQA